MPDVRKSLPDWLQRRSQASGERVASTPYRPAPTAVPTWLTQLTGAQPAPSPASIGTTTATDMPTTQELNAAYWRDRQHAEMLSSYGIEAEPIQDQTRVEIPEWLRSLLPEGFSERMFDAATGAPTTFTGGGPVVSGLQIPELEGGPEYLQTRGGREIPEEPYTIEQWLEDYKAGLIDDGLELQKQKRRRSVVSKQLQYLALQKPPETTDVGDYEGGGGGEGWWSPSIRGGGRYTPSKAASRWWMNLSKWNI